MPTDQTLRSQNDREGDSASTESSIGESLRPAKYLRDAIYGAMDGAVTTFAVVSGVTGAGLSPRVVLILGVAGVVGDGFSMAAGNYLGTKANMEQKAIDGAGLPPLVRWHAFEAALTTFVAFLAAGAIPLIPYIVASTVLSITSPAALSAGMTFTTFFAIGAAKSFFVRVRWWAAGIESLTIGSIAAALAYLCGLGLQHIA